MTKLDFFSTEALQKVITKRKRYWQKCYKLALYAVYSLWERTTLWDFVQEPLSDIEDFKTLDITPTKNEEDLFHLITFASPKSAEGVCTEKAWHDRLVTIPPVHHNFFMHLTVKKVVIVIYGAHGINRLWAGQTRHWLGCISKNEQLMMNLVQWALFNFSNLINQKSVLILI